MNRPKHNNLTPRTPSDLHQRQIERRCGGSGGKAASLLRKEAARGGIERRGRSCRGWVERSYQGRIERSRRGEIQRKRKVARLRKSTREEVKDGARGPTRSDEKATWPTHSHRSRGKWPQWRGSPPSLQLEIMNMGEIKVKP
jgi:hypothetical protein